MGTYMNSTNGFSFLNNSSYNNCNILISMMKIKEISLFSITFILAFLISYFIWWLKVEEKNYDLYSKEMQNFTDINYIHDTNSYIKEEKIENKNIEIISTVKNKTEKPIQQFENEEKIETKKYIEILFKPKELAYNINWNSKINYIYNLLDSKKFDNLEIKTSLTIKDENWKIRWNFHKNNINMYKYSLKEKEFLWVFIHELWHYVDIEFLNKNLLWNDLSNEFYNISWGNTKTIKKWQSISSFVSWYAMTNKYEDFAESFTYYILHNQDFKIKSQLNNNLKSKYNFFTKYIFKDNYFVNTNFIQSKYKDYYWDTTKIDYNLVDFIKYLNL